MSVERQGMGPITEGLGAPIRKILEERVDEPTTLLMTTGEEVVVVGDGLGWGRDCGDMWEHVTAWGPPGDAREVHFFFMSDVVSLRDTLTGALITMQKPGLDGPGSA